MRDSSEEKKKRRGIANTQPDGYRYAKGLYICCQFFVNQEIFESLKMKLVDFVCFEATVPQLQATGRDAVITELVSALCKVGKLEKKNVRKIVNAIIKRENEASTGIGKGIAIPHVKHPVAKDIIAAIGQTEIGIDFSSLDKQPVYSVILLISPADDPNRHLRVMETIFAHLQKEKFLKFLRQSKTAEQIEDLIREADENPSL